MRSKPHGKRRGFLFAYVDRVRAGALDAEAHRLRAFADAVWGSGAGAGGVWAGVWGRSRGRAVGACRHRLPSCR